jgi:hypothetical protein
MKNSIKTQSALIITLMLFISTSYGQWNKGIKGNGNITTITRTTSDYNAIRCSGSFDYILVSGNEGNIKIEGEENLLAYIITEIEYDGLVIKTKNNVNLKPSKNKTIKITIPFRDIERISLAGSGDLYNKDVINEEDLNISLAGSGDIVLDVKTSNVKAKIAGSGDITLKGKTDYLEADVTGSGDFHGFDLESNNTTVSVTGSGDAKVISNSFLKARVTGSGDIVYKGNPEKEDTKVAGSGSISN